MCNQKTILNFKLIFLLHDIVLWLNPYTFYIWEQLRASNIFVMDFWVLKGFISASNVSSRSSFNCRMSNWDIYREVGGAALQQSNGVFFSTKKCALYFKKCNFVFVS